ncbi:hypothetical protein C5167_006094 [Papaver somniferum]|uniref:High-affinity nitrate transporter n=1 Tax=Papaver somniferum TaxID=3469 RepID=A0A4Y7JFH4_PAPSO|nr:high-affinity nitrate transporter 3.2-like [Papaver somniferum]RZC58792.1 hypothetical protein C5167_006094 [Papaver somniferum]
MASTSLIYSLLVLCFASSTYGEPILFSSLQKSLLVEASPNPNQVLKSGEDKITVTWGLNQSFSDAEFKKVQVKLCFAPISQKERAWRKSESEISKDKTCQFTILTKPYSISSSNESFEWTIKRDIPSATYFVRVYVMNSADHEVAYGETTTDVKRTSNLFQIHGITGRHASLDIAAGIFSAVSVISLFGFFFMEKPRSKVSEQS